MPIFSTIDPSKSISHSNTATTTPAVVKSVTPHITSPQKSVVAEPANRPPTKRYARGRDTSMPMITDALGDEPKIEETKIISEATLNQYSNNETAYPFSQIELIEAWRTFVEKIDAPQLKSALGAREPSMTGEWQIEYELDTELQYNRLALDLKPKLQSYLRSHFRNEAIEIQFKVSNADSPHIHTPYTEAERWALLVEKYPALATLKSKFGLDFEHF